MLQWHKVAIMWMRGVLQGYGWNIKHLLRSGNGPGEELIVEGSQR